MLAAYHSDPADRDIKSRRQVMPLGLSIACTGAVVALLLSAPPTLEEEAPAPAVLPLDLITPRPEPLRIEPPVPVKSVRASHSAKATPGASSAAPPNLSFPDAVPLQPAPVAGPDFATSTIEGIGSGTRPGDGAGADGSGGDGAGDGAGRRQMPAPTFLTAQWVVQPGVNELARYYPYEARRLGISGSATLGCQVRRSRRLKNCTILSETPAGRFFGQAILAASANFRVYPPKVDGKISEDAWVAVTITMATRSSR